MTSCSKELRSVVTQKHPLQITTRTSKTPDFKFELLLLHSPLLEQSLLVSFPPLIDMLKFSGYPYLIRGQPRKIKGFSRQKSSPLTDVRINSTTPKAGEASPRSLRRAQLRTAPNTKHSLSGVMTLEQACPSEYQGAQCAFKDSMIH